MSAPAAGLRRYAARRRTDQWQPTDDATFVVAGSRAGSGASTVTALLALACAADGRRTLIVDTNEQQGSLARVLGVEATNGLVSLQDPSVDLERVIVGVSEHCWLIPGALGETPWKGTFGTSERRSVFRRIAQLYPSFDTIWFDAGSRLDGIIAAAGRGAWRFIGVSQADPVSLASAYAMVKAIETRWPGAPVEFLMNKHDEARATAGFEQIRAASGHFLGRSVNCAGTIPLEPTLSAAAAQGRPLRRSVDAGEAGSLTARVAVRLLAEFDDAPRS
ncbi:MAG TPA: hypothetical protein VE967_02595 [Gemmatimonadaceae bacterium]|nr:hypothetical protein [Gemmatimonadaceae bacterium]